jgi:uncharacterized protein YjbI with pentapeptide repeats
MANQDHIDLLLVGPDAWNSWRIANPATVPDFQGADLTSVRKEYIGYNFALANFQDTWLTMCRFIDCNFTEANLTSISAQGSYWRNVKLVRAEIAGDLVLSNFYVADLSGARLHSTGLIDAEMRYVRLNHSEFAGYLGQTHINSWTIIDSDLSGLLNATAGSHEYPSNVDIATLQRTARGIRGDTEKAGQLSEFFADCGLPREIISVFSNWAKKENSGEYLPTQERDYFSCFISYSHADKEFVKLLHDELVIRGVQCWLDDHEMVPGADLFDEIDRGIHNWDKVIFVCSEKSLKSPWVDRELEKAFLKEEDLWRLRGHRVAVIIPLDLDGYIWKWSSGKASVIRSRYVADFSMHSREAGGFGKLLEPLMRALDAEAARTRVVPPPKL